MDKFERKVTRPVVPRRGLKTRHNSLCLLDIFRRISYFGAQCHPCFGTHSPYSPEATPKKGLEPLRRFWASKWKRCVSSVRGPRHLVIQNYVTQSEDRHCQRKPAGTVKGKSNTVFASILRRSLEQILLHFSEA